jgi:YbbR domain-containing protein
VNVLNEQNIPEELTPDKLSGKKWNIPLIIISLLLSVLIWLWVIVFEGHVIQRTFPAIEVEILNFSDLRSSGYTILGNDNFYVDVTLEGKNSDLNRISRSEIQAYIDLQGIDRAGEVIRPIHIRDINYATVVAQNLSSIRVHIDKHITTSVPVAGEIIRIATDTNTETGDLVFTPEFVTVSGPEQLINTITHAWVKVDLGNALVERSTNVRESSVWMNSDGDEVRSPYIRPGENIIEVAIPIYTTKEVPLRVDYRHGYYNENNVNVRINPATVRLRGSPEHLNDLEEIIIDIIDEKEFYRDTTLRRPINLPGDAREINGITSADIEITFINMATRTLAVPASRFRITPPGDFEYHIQERNLNIQLFGPASRVNGMSGSAVLVSADLSGLTEAGPYSVPVSIVVAAEDSPVFAIGEYSINVEIY